MPMILFGVAAVLAALGITWGGIELHHVMVTYPGQFWMGVVAVLFIAFASAAARFRAATRQVPLRPRPPVPPPLSKAIQAVPVLTAVAAPSHEEARDCEGPECANKVDDDPWTAKVPGEPEHVFCSRGCARDWHEAWESAGQR